MPLPKPRTIPATPPGTDAGFMGPQFSLTLPPFQPFPCRSTRTIERGGMASPVASIVFCGASFGIVDEDDDGEQPGLQRFDAIDGATKEESEDAFLTEFTNVLYGGLSVKKVGSRP